MANPDKVVSWPHIDTRQLEVRFVKNVTGVGALINQQNMNVDGSVTPVEFEYKVQTGLDFYCTSINGLIVDNQAIDAGDFGGIPGGLPNGIGIDLIDAQGVVFNMLGPGRTIQINGDFALYAGVQCTHVGGGNKGLGFHWDLRESTGGIPCRFGSDTIFRVTINDDLTNLQRFLVSTHGTIVDPEQAGITN